MTLYIGQASRHTGDINLAAALMSVGIPLDPHEPVFLVEPENGKAYGSFSLLPYAEDGSESADHLLEVWNGGAKIHSDHGFAHICSFIRARPREIQRGDDLLAFAMDWLAERGDVLAGLRRFEDIPRFVQQLPATRAGYVLAYIWNRDVCYKLYQNARRKLYYRAGHGAETHHALLDSRLPRWQAKEILSRLNG